MILVVHLREVGLAQQHPLVPACRAVSVDPDPAVDFVEAHFVVDVAPHRAVALADDAAPAAATAHRRKPMAVLLSLLHPVGLPHRVLPIARRFGLGLCRVLAARVRDLRAVRLDGVQHRDELVRLVFLLGPAKATRVLRLPEALPSLRGVAARRACLFHAQPVTANRLTRALLLHPGPHDQLCRLEEAYLPDRDLRPLDLSLEPEPGYPPRARQHELAAEYSLDFQL